MPECEKTRIPAKPDRNEIGFPVPSAPPSVKALRYAPTADAAPFGRALTDGSAPGGAQL
jgi:hypothetical protein